MVNKSLMFEAKIERGAKHDFSDDRHKIAETARRRPFRRGPRRAAARFWQPLPANVAAANPPAVGGAHSGRVRESDDATDT